MAHRNGITPILGAGRASRPGRQVAPGGARKRARCLAGTRAIPRLGLRAEALSWRLARNPLFHAAITRSNDECA